LLGLIREIQIALLATAGGRNSKPKQANEHQDAGGRSLGKRHGERLDKGARESRGYAVKMRVESSMEPKMTESEYTRLAEETLSRIEQALEAVDDGLDFELAPGGILEVEFDNGSKIIINKQAAVQEIWVAAKSGGFHYRWNEGAWQDTRSGEELFAALSRFATEQAGTAIELQA